MKRILLTFVLISLAMAGGLLPIACSSNNNPTAPATATITPTTTPTNWAGYTNTFTLTPTVTATSTPTNQTATFTTTFTPTTTFTSTATGTLATFTPSFTPTNSPTPTNTITSTVTTTPTNTFIPTSTFSAPTPAASGTPWVTAYPPNGLAGNSAGSTLYVAEGDGTGAGAVELFNASGVSQALWTAYGTQAFGQPNGVALDASGNVYVVDQVNNSVYGFSSSGATVVSWSSWSGGSVTSFKNPEGIAVDGAGNIYVADTGNNTVEQFTVSGATVNYINQWNNGTNAFSSPSAVAAVTLAGPATMLYVADAGNELVQAFNGTSWSSWATVPNSDLFGITYNNGHIYAADLPIGQNQGQVEEYDTTGNILAAWTGSFSTSSPDGVIVTPSNDVLVTDFYNSVVDKYGP